MTTRRTKIEMPVPPANGTPTRPTSTTTKPQDTPPAHNSPYLPTGLESLLLALYPATLLIGSLFSLLHPSTRSATYLPHSQAYDPTSAPSYFAKKSNLFNVYFVKIGWFWTTLAFAVLILSHSSLGPPLRAKLTRRRQQAVVRYACITAVWVGVTQWFFGPAIIDRGFMWTGGKCERIYSGEEMEMEGDSKFKATLTHAACKAIGGQWKGGHDISGHVFLLILGSGMLWMELLPAMLKLEGLREARRILTRDGLVRSAAVEQGREHEVTREQAQVTSWGTKAALGVAGASWWMLLMTAAYFHTWFEKFTGLLVAFTAIYVVYFLPRAVPAWRAVVGMPGV